MQLTKLIWRKNDVSDTKKKKVFAKFVLLLEEINRREILPTTTEKLNAPIDALSSMRKKEFNASLTKTLDTILRILFREEKIVPAGHYKMLWVSIGMAAFGIPMGVAFSVSLNNYAEAMFAARRQSSR